LLCDAIVQNPQHRITFADYMETVLYHPQHGYYTTQAPYLGKSGDFYTSTHLGPDLGELLAEQFVQMWQILGQPESFTLLEMGAGQGWLAQDILSYLRNRYPKFYQAIAYRIVERSPALIDLQRDRLRTFQSTETEQSSNTVQWITWEDCPKEGWIGCAFSNELVDALPVHQVQRVGNQIQEVYVTLPSFVQTGSKPRQSEWAESELSEEPENAPQLVETLADCSTPRLQEYFTCLNLDLTDPVYSEGYRTEINLTAQDWLAQVARCLRQGYLLTIDYGYTSDRLHSPLRRSGTLQCYYQHLRHANPYKFIGYQDITTHVNFTALEQWGKQLELIPTGFTQQSLFLMALGLGDRLAALSSTNGPPISLQTLLARRDALHALIDPIGLGGFGVLIQSKGLTSTQKQVELRGLSQTG